MADTVDYDKIISKVACDTCGIEFYNQHKLCPKILKCNHTFCSTCIEKLYKIIYCCPKCSRPIERDPSDLPINYSLLKASENFRSLKHAIAGHINLMKYLVQNLEASADKIITNKMKENIKNISTEIKGNYRDIEKIIEEHEIQPEPILLDNFSSFQDFIKYIILKLQNNKKVFVTASIEGMRYGKVSLWNNMILFHSLCLPVVPPDSSLVMLHDIYRHQNLVHEIAFLNISYNQHGYTGIMTFDVALSDPGEKFIFNCLGIESVATSYKNIKFTHGESTETYDEIVKVVLPGSEDYKIEVYSPYDNNDFSNGDMFLDEMIIQTHSNGNFIIFCSKCFFINVKFTARLHDPLTFRNLFDYTDQSMLKIVDCGYVIKY